MTAAVVIMTLFCLVFVLVLREIGRAMGSALIVMGGFWFWLVVEHEWEGHGAAFAGICMAIFGSVLWFLFLEWYRVPKGHVD